MMALNFHDNIKYVIFIHVIRIISTFLHVIFFSDYICELTLFSEGNGADMTAR